MKKLIITSYCILFSTLLFFLSCEPTNPSSTTPPENGSNPPIKPPIPKPPQKPKPPVNELPPGLEKVEMPKREDLLTLAIDNNFKTYPEVKDRVQLDDFKNKLGITAFRLAATKESKEDYYVENFNYITATDDPPRLIVVAGKEALVDSFGEVTQNSLLNLETRAGIEGLAKTKKFQGSKFAEQLSKYRIRIADYLKDKNLSAMNNEEIEKDIPREENLKRMSEFIEAFYANTNLEMQKFNRASLVITQIWKQDKRPYKIDSNLGQMYVVPPNTKTKDFKDHNNAWLGAIFDSGYNIIANAINVLESRKLDKLAIQLHLIGAGKFKPEDVSVALTNKVFTWAIKYGIDNLLPTSAPDKFKLREKLILHFAFTPYN